MDPSRAALDRADDEIARLAMDAAGIGAWRWDPMNNIVHLSSRSGELLALYTPGMALSELLEHIHPSDRQAVGCALRREARVHFGDRIPCRRGRGSIPLASYAGKVC
jgi:PAS domain-containing protein